MQRTVTSGLRPPVPAAAWQSLGAKGQDWEPSCADSTEIRALSLLLLRGDRDEPQHVHVEWGDSIARLWLDPIRLQGSGGFSRVEIGRIEPLVSDHRFELMEA